MIIICEGHIPRRRSRSQNFRIDFGGNLSLVLSEKLRPRSLSERRHEIVEKAIVLDLFTIWGRWPQAFFQVEYNLPQFFKVSFNFCRINLCDKVNDRASIPLHCPVQGNDIAKCGGFDERYWDILEVPVFFQQDGPQQLDHDWVCCCRESFAL